MCEIRAFNRLGYPGIRTIVGLGCLVGRSFRNANHAYGFRRTDASLNAETLLRPRVPLAGLMAGDHMINVASAERPTP